MSTEFASEGQSGRPGDRESPDEARLHALAEVLHRQGRGDELIALYQHLVSTHPQSARGHFNLACALRARGHDEAALAAHRRAITLGVEQPQEAWSNIGVILGDLRRDSEAREAFDRALALDPHWIPALYNLALWHEEHAEREAALALFERILALAPDYHQARVRIAHLRRVRRADDPLIAALGEALRQAQLAPFERESLLFALAKVQDDCGRHEAAFAACRAANELSRARMQTYARHGSEALFDSVRATFTGDLLERIPALSQRPLLFICGMFRSGTTLIEQMLGAHPAIRAGGEIGYWNARLRRDDSGFPRRIVTDTAGLTALGAGYLELLERRFPGAALVCDKRPDNFLYLGLLHALFPGARFIHMQRDPRDTCLSIYFQQLDGTLGYSCDLGDTAHYLRQYQRLMRHWRGLFPEAILDIAYEQLVEDPERELRRACAFLALDWDDSMLRFSTAGGRVRTASVWQVREPLHARSVGRWQHYATQLGAISATLAQEPLADEP